MGAGVCNETPAILPPTQTRPRAPSPRARPRRTAHRRYLGTLEDPVVACDLPGFRAGVWEGFVRPLGESADPTLSHLGHHPSPPHPPTQASLLATSLPRPPPPCRAEAVVPSPPSWPTQESSGRGPGAKADPGTFLCLPDLQSCHLACAGLSPGYPAFCCPKSL